VVPTSESVHAHAQLQALGAKVTLDLIPGLGHGIDAHMMACLHERLSA
jgi:phospholipase/carboxylesterase